MINCYPGSRKPLRVQTGEDEGATFGWVVPSSAGDAPTWALVRCHPDSFRGGTPQGSITKLTR